MYSDEELQKIILNIVATHPTLDHKLHLLEAVDEIFKKVKRLEQEKAGLYFWKEESI